MGMTLVARHGTWLLWGPWVDPTTRYALITAGTGFSHLGRGIKGKVAHSSFLRRELQREKVWSRIHLVPLLLAEGDRDAYRRQHAALEREKEIMKDVPGWEVCGPLAGGADGTVWTLANWHVAPPSFSATLDRCRQGRAYTTTRGFDLRTPLWCFDHASLYVMRFSPKLCSRTQSCEYALRRRSIAPCCVTLGCDKCCMRVPHKRLAASVLMRRALRQQRSHGRLCANCNGASGLACLLREICARSSRVASRLASAQGWYSALLLQPCAFVFALPGL